MHAESSMIGGVLGGLGLLLLGMRLMTDGLRLAAGARLRTLLERATGGRLRALLTGALITSLVQSSSVVTVATLGFVNAGILALHNALWVIFGSNVGTTMTGWLVALTGLDFNLEALALPLVGAGALLQLVGFRRRGASAGALAGFGLFFLGLGVIRDAFGGMTPNAALAGADPGWLGDLAALGIGLVATFVTQSSSASIALTISAAAAGLLGLDAAGAMVIGANLGTTSTAILATLRATPNARRAAAAHVVFNLLAASVALVLLPWLLDLLQALLGRGEAPAVASTLALFHTTFNLLGVIMIWPLSQKLEDALGRRFVSEGELESRPRFLDDTVLTIPALALEATRREMGRVAHLALHLHLDAIRTPAPTVEAIATRREGMAALLQAMQEARVTAGGHTHPLPLPFHVFATQNPIEQEGTFPLPEAQLDRFMIQIRVGYPDAESEAQIIAMGAEPGPEPSAVLTPAELQRHQALCRRITVPPSVVQQAVALLRATRPEEPSCPRDARELIQWGAGPRAGQQLIAAAQARAALAGRPAASADDLRALAIPVLEHRLVRSFVAESRGVTSEAIMRMILDAGPR
ncbi:MAG: Na/Pi symporter [Myxococcales bacterium]|nr:Na/Pi symporter [Myxococcales bacterium]